MSTGAVVAVVAGAAVAIGVGVAVANALGAFGGAAGAAGGAAGAAGAAGDAAGAAGAAGEGAGGVGGEGAQASSESGQGAEGKSDGGSKGSDKGQDGKDVNDKDAERAKKEAEDKDLKRDATPSQKGSLTGVHFERDMAFPLPDAIPMFRGLTSLTASEPNRTLLIVGHADATGADDHNMQVTLERSAVVSAYLRNDVDAFYAFYGPGTATKAWGAGEDQLMLKALPFGKKPYLEERPDGSVSWPEYQTAIRTFQKAKGLGIDGIAGEQTRRALIEEYMGAEGTTPPQETKIVMLGCGSRHPINEKDKTAAENRRVDVYAFEHDKIYPDPADCADGDHNDCDVIAKWEKAVKGQINPEEAGAAQLTPPGQGVAPSNPDDFGKPPGKA